MSTIANRVREIAEDLAVTASARRGIGMAQAERLAAIATELEAAHAAEPALWMTPDQTAWSHEQGAHGRGKVCTEAYYSASTVAALQARIAELQARQVPAGWVAVPPSAAAEYFRSRSTCAATEARLAEYGVTVVPAAPSNPTGGA